MIYLFTHKNQDFTEFNGYYYYDEGTIICVMLSDFYMYEPQNEQFVAFKNDKYFIIPPSQTIVDIFSFVDLNNAIEKYTNLIIFSNI
jgi:hypothetical protein